MITSRISIRLVFLAAAGSLSAQVATNPTAGTVAVDQAVVLSPFTVESGREKGYPATQTLNGRRVKPDLCEVGSTLTLLDVDTRDGKHTPATAIYTLKEPRTYQFTSTFRF